MNKADIREIRTILLLVLAFAIAVGFLIWEEGDKAIEELREWFVIRAWLFGPLILLMCIAGVAQRLQMSKSKRDLEARKTTWPRDYVRDFVKDVVPMGLIPSLSGVDIDEAVERAIAAAGRTFDPEFAMEGANMDMLFLCLGEPKSIHWTDLERDVMKENLVYEEWFEELAEISHGAFHPKNVVESWETEHGPIKVDFELQDTKYTVNPKYDGDWLDLGVLHSLNDFIRPSGYQFEVPIRCDQTATTLCLKAPQKEILKKRGWVFEESFDTPYRYTPYRSPEDESEGTS